MKNFQQRKKDVLSKLEKSSLGKWDEKIVSLCDKINSLENYYTTSSCSGRILLMIDQEKKAENLFLFVSHDKIKFDNLKNILKEIVSPSARNNFGSEIASRQISPPLNFVNALSKLKLGETVGRKRGDNKSERSEQNELKNKNVKFKMEPCILHVACESLEDAEKLFEIGKNAGFKRLGIIGTSHGFTFELNSSEKLEFPIIQNKKILVDDEFLKIAVDEANRKLEKSWMRIRKLEREI